MILSWTDGQRAHVLVKAGPLVNKTFRVGQVLLYTLVIARAIRRGKQHAHRLDGRFQLRDLSTRMHLSPLRSSVPPSSPGLSLPPPFSWLDARRDLFRFSPGSDDSLLQS
ncbi:unnamed protein product [Mycena citricolor]|uniref:Uncharacterized protein n=1 Tax=Mycena citricolor TaxID=2018698 RepID=A0AAD2HES0_9AGAR|nr:unnamed protein product [Mycena citricolor]